MKKRQTLFLVLLLACCLLSWLAATLPPESQTDPAPGQSSGSSLIMPDLSTPESGPPDSPEHNEPDTDPSSEAANPAEEFDPSSPENPAEEPLSENGSYTSKEDVSLFLHQYGRLPDNFITKSEARDLGWSGGSLEPYAPGMCIGGDRFGNREGLLPQAKGRSYTECDIDTLGADSRGAKRIVFSNDGLIYYTGDHYESFELLYDDRAS